MSKFYGAPKGQHESVPHLLVIPPTFKETQVRRLAERRDRARHTQNKQDTQQKLNPTTGDAETIHKHEGRPWAAPSQRGRAPSAPAPLVSDHVCVSFLHLRLWDLCFCCVFRVCCALSLRSACLLMLLVSSYDFWFLIMKIAFP